MFDDLPIELSPKEFEDLVADLIWRMGASLSDFHVDRLESLAGTDGDYEIDVTARFEALGAEYITLIECKRHSHPIKREVLMVLNDRLRSTGAHKGMVFSTAPFQAGAVQYAKVNKIALVQIADGRTAYLAKSEADTPLPPWADAIVGWFVIMDDEGSELHTLICHGNSQLLEAWLTES